VKSYKILSNYSDGWQFLHRVTANVGLSPIVSSKYLDITINPVRKESNPFKRSAYTSILNFSNPFCSSENFKSTYEHKSLE